MTRIRSSSENGFRIIGNPPSRRARPDSWRIFNAGRKRVARSANSWPSIPAISISVIRIEMESFRRSNSKALDRCWHRLRGSQCPPACSRSHRAHRHRHRRGVSGVSSEINDPNSLPFRWLAGASSGKLGRPSVNRHSGPVWRLGPFGAVLPSRKTASQRSISVRLEVFLTTCGS